MPPCPSLPDLKLSDADKLRIAQAHERLQNTLKGLDEDKEEEMIKAARATAKEIVAGLGKEQQEAWSRLAGDPVPFVILERFVPESDDDLGPPPCNPGARRE